MKKYTTTQTWIGTDYSFSPIEETETTLTAGIHIQPQPHDNQWLHVFDTLEDAEIYVEEETA